MSLETGGLENGVVNLINNASEECRVDVLCLRARGVLADRVVNPAANVYWNGKESSLKESVSILRELNANNKYDIIHSHGWTTLLVAVLGSVFFRSKVLNGEHGTLFFDSFKRRIIQKFLFKTISGNVTVSASLRDEITKRLGLSHQNFTVVSNGVDTEKFKSSDETRFNIREKLNVEQGVFIVGTVGRLVPVKNYTFLVQAFNEFRKNCSESRLLIVGEGIEREKLQRLAEQLGILDVVIFTGERPDIAELISSMDLFMLTSLDEGMSNTLLEAMSSSVPVLASNVGGAQEIVAEGKADAYPRYGPTMEWDIAAGHAILEHAGGTLTDFDGNKILYGKQDFKNPSLIVKGKIFYD